MLKDYFYTKYMAYVITDNCICWNILMCWSMPSWLFLWSKKFLVINPNECIDCGVCEPECPAGAIKSSSETDIEKWIEINSKYSKMAKY